MASLRNLVIIILRLAGAASIAAALRYHARRPSRPLGPGSKPYRRAHPAVHRSSPGRGLRVRGWFGTWFPAEPFCMGLGVIGV